MPLGNTAKKIGKVADMAEDLYGKMNELREQVVATKETVEETNRRVDRLEGEAAEQRALLEAVAEAQGIDLDDATPDGDDDATGDTPDDATADTSDGGADAGGAPDDTTADGGSSASGETTPTENA